jgi:hypothetical protein
MANNREGSHTPPDPRKLGAYIANVAYDLWSVGVVLYYVTCATPLWKTNLDDNLVGGDLVELCNWDKDRGNLALMQGGIGKKKLALYNLLSKLLVADPVARVASWGGGEDAVARAVLRHPFFSSSMEMPEEETECTLQTIDAVLKKLSEGQRAIGGKLNQSLELLGAQSRMMKEVGRGSPAGASAYTSQPCIEVTIISSSLFAFKLYIVSRT